LTLPFSGQGDISQIVMAICADRGQSLTKTGNSNHLFQVRLFLKNMCGVCIDTPNGLDSAHSCAVTWSSDVGLCTDPICRISGCLNRTEYGIDVCFPSKLFLGLCQPVQDVGKMPGQTMGTSLILNMTYILMHTGKSI
jgi:hypothetical protein